MKEQTTINVTIQQYAYLREWQINPPAPYLRDRASAILQVASGKPIWQVATELPTPVGPAVVQGWVVRFQARGLPGLADKQESQQ